MLKLMSDHDKTLALLTRLGLAVDAAGDNLLSDAMLTASKEMQKKTLTMEEFDHLARMLEGRDLQGFGAAGISAVVELFRVTTQLFPMAQACDKAG